MATSSDKPKTITGSCLCGSIRYTAVFPPHHDFDDCVGTCQCPSCRKTTGSLMFRFYQFKNEDVTFHSQSTLKACQASPGKDRAFCGDCGSFLFYRGQTSQHINLAVGCIDKEWLKQYGTLLTKAGANLWCEDEIAGVTDHLTGERFDRLP